MSLKLKDLVTVKTNNEHCVILEVIPGHDFDLIALGCFDGNETHFRLTKGQTVTCTVFRKDDKPYSWYWGRGGHQLVSPAMSQKGRLIQDCIEKHFKIKCEEY